MSDRAGVAWVGTWQPAVPGGWPSTVGVTDVQRADDGHASHSAWVVTMAAVRFDGTAVVSTEEEYRRSMTDG